uniref:Uncharacterized protein n=1 Tax=Tanacetum cinerariifolium TaxID=118510 RepID=A0A699KRV8_TANCI|nr:hypothetical protein [Tanacetum cinerariifolium]
MLQPSKRSKIVIQKPGHLAASLGCAETKVKEYQEKDKIKSKPDKNGKRDEAEKSQKQSQSIKQEKLKKIQREGPKVQTHSSFIKRKKKKGAEMQLTQSYKERDQNCQCVKAVSSKD